MSVAQYILYVKKTCMSEPWYTSGIINACKKKNNLYKAWLCKKDIVSEQRYKKYKNKLTNIMRKAEKVYYRNKLEQHKGDVKKIWSTINEVIRRGNHTKKYSEFMYNGNNKVYNKQVIANMFNDFYINIGPKLASDIDTKNVDTQYDYYLKNMNIANSMYINPCSEEEIVKVISGFKSKNSQDTNGLSMSLIKQVKESIKMPLNIICNLSFSTGVFPSKMKIAKVLPLFKADNEHIVSNYRPVSILTQFSKVLKKLFEKRLREFIDKNDILFDGQYGFRANRSTGLALTELVDTISNALDKNKYCIGVFIDLKKAFDTVDHTLLIEKFKYYGVRGITSKFLESYLCNRTQFVNYDNCNSTEQSIKCGVPQGSILGPLLFILYINDMCKVSDLLRFIIFADDTNIFCIGDDLASLTERLNRELVKLTKWFRINKLSLNVSKSNYMVFGKKSAKNVVVKLNGVELESVPYTKFLGVYIDYELNWGTHIQTVCRKISKVIGVMFKIKDKVDRAIMVMLYNTLILPYLSYCCEIWGNTYASRLHNLNLLQKRVIRVIDKADYLEHTSSLFRKYKMLKLIDIIMLNTCILMYKANKGSLPKHIQSSFVKNKEVHEHNTRRKNDFYYRQTSTKMRKMSVNQKGIELWNGLPNSTKNCVTMFKFKAYLKFYMLSKY